MGAKPSSEAPAKGRRDPAKQQLSRKFVDALVDSTSIDELLEVVQRRMEHATPQTTSVALRHLTVRNLCIQLSLSLPSHCPHDPCAYRHSRGVGVNVDCSCLNVRMWGASAQGISAWCDRDRDSCYLTDSLPPTRSGVLSLCAQELWSTADGEDADATWQDDPRFRALVVRVCSLVKSMNNRTCGNVCWAFAKIQYSDPAVFQILVRGTVNVPCDPSCGRERHAGVPCAAGSCQSGQGAVPDRPFSPTFTLSCNRRRLSASRRSVWMAAPTRRTSQTLRGRSP